MVGDEGGAVGAFVVVDGHSKNFTRTKRVNGGACRCSQIQTNVMVTHPLEERRGVHRRTMLIVTADGIHKRCFPSFGLGLGEIVHPIGTVKNHRRVERRGPELTHGQG